MNNQVTNDILAELAKIKAENEALKQAMTRKASGHNGLRVSEKGALSLYGLGRFPVTLYKSQWSKLLAKSSEIQEFIKANESILKEKADA